MLLAGTLMLTSKAVESHEYRYMFIHYVKYKSSLRAVSVWLVHNRKQRWWMGSCLCQADGSHCQEAETGSAPSCASAIEMYAEMLSTKNKTKEVLFTSSSAFFTFVPTGMFVAFVSRGRKEKK